jgi:hypothetical protein
MAKIGRLTLKGDSDEEYPFQVHHADTEFKDLPAVYCYSKRYNKGGKWKHKVLYIGHTDDLSTEFEEHPHESCIRQQQPNCISIHVQEVEKKRAAMVNDLIPFYNPPCNNQKPNNSNRKGIFS